MCSRRCLVVSSIFVGCVAVFVGLVRARLPPREFVIDSCRNQPLPANGTLQATRTLPGLPFECGWQSLRPGKRDGVFAYIQPVGSWCWSNAGFIQGNGDSEGVLVDTLIDPVLTSKMLKNLTTNLGLHPTALVYTHGDVDHVLGDQELPRTVPRLARAELENEIVDQAKIVPDVLVIANTARWMWELAELFGWRVLPSLLPRPVWRLVRKVLGWAFMQSRLASFHMHVIDPELMVGVTVPIKELRVDLPLPASTAPRIELVHMGRFHSKSDTILLVPDRKVCFAGDLLFIGIAPLMWGGPARAWISALDQVLEETDNDWLFVPGHGPVTDVEGVKLVRRYFLYLDEGVTMHCSETNGITDDAGDDAACALLLLNKLPLDLRHAFSEPQRILISARIERQSRRAGGPVRTSLWTKARLMAEQGEYVLEDMLSAGSI